mmetsp:Transcript_79436/g.227975  ORF Transcript_79436/g.227975 Transcript_79436/m.227975 type:complete len:583 (-) Transcript_79436:92-1840(-)
MTLAIGFIMVIELCERVGYYTFQSTQKSWLQNQGYSNASSSSMNQVFGLLSYVSCFFGGWLAETPLGRYRTIMALVAVYVAGCFLAAIATHLGIESVPLYFVGTFFLIALGTGGIKPNVCTFGADQIDPALPDVDKRKESFFMYFYLMINVGCLIAFGFLANVATAGLPGLILADEGFFYAYMISAGLMAFALVAYISGTPWYRKESFQTNSKAVLGPCVHRLWAGRDHLLGKVALAGWALLPLLIIVSIVQAVLPSGALTTVSLVLDVLCIGCLCIAHTDNRWLGEADAMTKCLDAVPAILVGNVTFNVLYNTMSSVFYSQSCQMDTRLGSGADAMQLNGAFFNLGDALAIIIFTPLIDRCFLPVAEWLAGRKIGYDLKILTGIGFAMAAQAIAALLEYFRKQGGVLPIGSKCAPLLPDGQHVEMSDFSAFWMSVPYAMIGIGEVLVNPVLQHVAYAGADPSMRSLMQAFNLFAMGGLPNAVSAAMTQATASFVPNDLNQGNLPLVYLINIVFGVLGCLVYMRLSSLRKGAQGPQGTPCGAKDVESPVVQLPALLGERSEKPVAGDTKVHAEAGDVAVLQA